MSKHYTRNTVSVMKWCSREKKQTPHRVDDRRVGPCLSCIDKAEALQAARRATEAQAVKQEAFKFS